MDKVLGSGGKRLSSGVRGEVSSSLSWGVTVERANLACFSWGDFIAEGSLLLRDNGVGESRCLERRPWVWQGVLDITWSNDLGFNLTDGDSSMMRSVSPSMLSGDACMGDNLLVVNLGT